MIENEVIYMTVDEANALDKEIAELEERIADASASMNVARKEGDLRENAEYEFAENDLFGARHDLAEKKARRSVAKIIDSKDASKGKSGVITRNSTISLSIGNRKFKDISFTSGRDEPFKSISLKSKVGALLMGRRAGEQFTYVDNLFREQTVVIESVE